MFGKLEADIMCVILCKNLSIDLYIRKTVIALQSRNVLGQKILY